ncbi:hypothetical protein VOLCADRAFT_88070 [Volvox carteri f. nagariensis]|uniref:GRIP domain-containing protein n=1 Tax=Volvox carteri f. nagariensis TaxID=3068 RepID=D8TMZ8_VOLCA|nr:uncharacterized protein VOLCADRAFT_88070 [Volvox carteri f. nagariensis]EFJ51341.1 hypothetical protein VOLCADRAFT_88070 [Volvox carteri f. nagariensis]|eukprot:XP_002947808.1 hypothetical protein VOLCADRAFT_88070 [Volvox carteri f. nagariensis]
MTQFASGAVGKNLQEGLGTLATKAQGILGQGLPKNAPPGSTPELARSRDPMSAGGVTSGFALPVESQLQLQEPYSADEEGAVLRQQVVQLQVKNGMLQAELEEARGFAEEAARLRGLVSDMEVKLLFALKGTDGMQPLLPKVIQEQQKRIDELTSALAERNGQTAGLRADNARLRCQVEDLMSKMASSARHAEATHNEQLRELHGQLMAAQEQVRQLRAAAMERRSDGGGRSGDEAAALREQLAHARNVIKELEEEAEELRAACDKARTAHGGGSGGGGNSSAEALEWRIAELEEQLEEANDKLQEAERKLGSRSSGATASGSPDMAALEAEVQKLRGELESERRKVADVAAAAAAEAVLEGEAALQRLQKRLAEVEKGEQLQAAARNAVERHAGELEAQLEALRTEHQRAMEAAATESTGAKAAIKAEEAAVAELQSQLDAATVRIGALERDFAAANEQCAALQQQLSAAVARAASSEASAEQLRAKEAATRMEAAEAHSRADATAAQLNELQRAVAVAEQRAGELATELVVTQRKLETATERIVLYTEREHEAEQIVATYSAAEARYADAQEELAQLRDRNEKLREALALAEVEAAAARDEAEQRQEQAQLANEKVAQLRAHLDKLRERKAGLETQVQELQDKLAASQLEVEAAKSSLAAQDPPSRQAGVTAVAALIGAEVGVVSELPRGNSVTAASSQTIELPAASVSTDTAGLPRAEMPTASTDTEGLPRLLMPTASTDTEGLPRLLMPTASTDTEGLPRLLMPTASTDTTGLPRPDMPSAATDTIGLPRALMPTASTDTEDLPSQPRPVAEYVVGAKAEAETAGAATETEPSLDVGAEPEGMEAEEQMLRQKWLVSELTAQLEAMQLSAAALVEQLKEREAEVALLRAATTAPGAAHASQVGAIEVGDGAVVEASLAQGANAEAETVAEAAAEVAKPAEAAAVPGRGWDQEEWDAWDGDEQSPQPGPAPASSTNATAATAAVGASLAADGIAEAGGSGAAAPAADGTLDAAEARVAVYASELALLQDTIKQLLSCWSGSAAAPMANGYTPGHDHGHSNGDRSSPGIHDVGSSQETAVLGSTVVALLGQLQAHFEEAAFLRHQLVEAAEELERLQARVSAAEAHGGNEDGDVAQRLEELEGEMAHMMQDMAAAEQRAQAAEAAAAAAASLRQQLEHQLQRSDEAAASADANLRQLGIELDAALSEAKLAGERAAEAATELASCRAELAEMRAALEAAEGTGAAKLAVVEKALAESRAASEAAETRAADALAAASAAEARLNEQEARLVLAEQALASATAAVEVNATEAAAPPPPPGAASSPISPEHLGLMRQIAAAAQTFAPLFHAVKASCGSVDELSQRVSELEALATKLMDIVAAGGAPAAPPSYEQSFKSRNIGPAAAMLLAAEAVAAAVEETSAAADRPAGGASPSGNPPPDLPKILTRNLSASRRVSDDASLRLRLEMAEAAVRSAESELRIQTNLAESLRAELQELQAALEARRAATVSKTFFGRQLIITAGVAQDPCWLYFIACNCRSSDHVPPYGHTLNWTSRCRSVETVAAMEASYKEQIMQLQGYLNRAADKQARQIAAFEEEHSQALAVEQAQRAAAVAAAAKAAEERAAGLELQLEAVQLARVAAEGRVAAAEVAAEEAKRLAQDIERGWGERLERLQKINKKRAAELDEARAESSGLSERLAALTEQVTSLQAELLEAQRQLESERASGGELRARLASLQEAGDSTGLEVSELRSRAEAADAQVADLEQRVTTAEARLLASEADRSKLADQLVLLHSLREERAAALAALAEARDGQAGFEALRVRCEAAEAARDRTAQELSRVTAMMGNLEARLQQVEDENEGLVAELDEERRRGAALARTWAGELEALPTLPRDRWPAAVRRLVDGLESRAGQAVETSSRVSDPSGHSHADDSAAAELEALREAAKAAAERTARVEAQAAAANAALDALRRQMDEARARADAEARMEGARRLGELEEIQGLRDKSRTLLEEKELEADALRAQLRQARTAAAGLGAGSSSTSLLYKAGAGSNVSLTTVAPAPAGPGDGEAHLQHQRPLSGSASNLLQPQLSTSSSGIVANSALQLQGATDPAVLALRSQIAALQHELEEYKWVYGGEGAAYKGPCMLCASHRRQRWPFVLNIPEHLSRLESSHAYLDAVDKAAIDVIASILACHILLPAWCFRHAYEDAESTHQLRDTAQAALREELARLQAQMQVSNQDVQYLRAAIISFFESGSLPREGPVLQVLSRLLRFTPTEMAGIAAADHAHRSGRRGTGVSGAAPATHGPGQHAAAGAGGGGLGLLASVTSKVASAVSGRTQSQSGIGGPALPSLMPQLSFGHR